jgi:hypothetical protein
MGGILDHRCLCGACVGADLGSSAFADDHRQGKAMATSLGYASDWIEYLRRDRSRVRFGWLVHGDWVDSS